MGSNSDHNNMWKHVRFPESNEEPGEIRENDSIRSRVKKILKESPFRYRWRREGPEYYRPSANKPGYETRIKIPYERMPLQDYIVLHLKGKFPPLVKKRPSKARGGFYDKLGSDGFLYVTEMVPHAKYGSIGSDTKYPVQFDEVTKEKFVRLPANVYRRARGYGQTKIFSDIAGGYITAVSEEPVRTPINEERRFLEQIYSRTNPVRKGAGLRTLREDSSSSSSSSSSSNNKPGQKEYSQKELDKETARRRVRSGKPIMFEPLRDLGERQKKRVDIPPREHKGERITEEELGRLLGGHAKPRKYKGRRAQPERLGPLRGLGGYREPIEIF